MANRNEWRYSFHRPRLWIVDYRLSIILLAAFMHIKLWTFAVAFVSLICFLYIERVKRISMESSWRMAVAKLTNFIQGNRRPVRHVKKQSFFIDHECYNNKQGQDGN